MERARGPEVPTAREAAKPTPARVRPGAATGTLADDVLTLQRKIGNQAVVQLLAASGGDGEASRAVIQRAVAGGGRAVDDGIRAGVESRFGADLSAVRVHSGPSAEASAAALGASAYTVGDDIVLGEGSASPSTLHHELTHVVQQRRGPVAGTSIGGGVAVSDPSDRFEREAESVAADLSAGRTAPAAPRGVVADGGGVGGAVTSVQRATVPKWMKSLYDFLRPDRQSAAGKAAPAGSTRPAAKRPDQPFGYAQPFSNAAGAPATGSTVKGKRVGNLEALRAGGKHDYADPDEKKRNNFATAKATMGAQAGAGVQVSEGEAQAIAMAAAQMGLGAEARGQVGDDDSFHAGGGASISAALGARANAGAAGGLMRNDKGNVTNLYGRADVGAGAELAGALGVEGEAGWKSLAVGAGLDASGSIAAETHAGVGASIGSHGLNLDGRLGASAAASAEAEATVEFKAKDAAVELGLGGDAWAGAVADAHGTFQMGPTGVKIGGGATIGAGATANATGSAYAKLYDRKVIGGKASIGVQAGYLYSATGWFEMKGGYLRINAGLAASLLAPVGGNVNVEPYVDLKPLGVAIMRSFYGAKWRRNGVGAKDVIDTPATADKALDAFQADLQLYSDTKFRLLQTKSAYNYVKIEKVQQLVNKHIPYFEMQARKKTAAGGTKDGKVAHIDDQLKARIEKVLKPDPDANTAKQAGQKTTSASSVTAFVDYGAISDIVNLYDTGGMQDIDDPAFQVAVDQGGATSSTQTLSTVGS